MKSPAALVALVALLFASGPGCSKPAPSSRPDVLLISIDTLRADRLSCYGYERQTSPGIDRLAQEGMRFESAIAPSIHTAPSHMSMFTGLDPVAHGVNNLFTGGLKVKRLNDEVPVLPELVQAAGWYTVAFTDRGNLLPSMGFDRGWDHSEVRFQSMPRKVNEFELWLKTAPEDKPLFAFLHTYETHSPYVPPAALHGTFCNLNYRGPIAGRYKQLERAGTSGLGHDHAKDYLIGQERFRPVDHAFISSLYDECVLSADQQVTRIWQDWKSLRPDRELILVLFSDHGEQLGEGGLYGHNSGTSAELTKVPLVMVGPGIPRGVQHQPISMSGLAPTLLELLDLPALGTSEGQAASFLDLVRDPAARIEARPPITQLWGPHRRSNYDAVLRDGKHLSRAELEELVSLQLEDWSTGKPRALEDPVTEAELLALLEERHAFDLDVNERIPAHKGPAVSPEEVQQLEDLGYVGDE